MEEPSYTDRAITQLREFGFDAALNEAEQNYIAYRLSTGTSPEDVVYAVIRRRLDRYFTSLSRVWQSHPPRTAGEKMIVASFAPPPPDEPPAGDVPEGDAS